MDILRCPSCGHRLQQRPSNKFYYCEEKDCYCICDGAVRLKLAQDIKVPRDSIKPPSSLRNWYKNRFEKGAE
jgi:hypothetical protein